MTKDNDIFEAWLKNNNTYALSLHCWPEDNDYSSYETRMVKGAFVDARAEGYRVGLEVAVRYLTETAKLATAAGMTAHASAWSIAAYTLSIMAQEAPE